MFGRSSFKEFKKELSELVANYDTRKKLVVEPAAEEYFFSISQLIGDRYIREGLEFIPGDLKRITKLYINSLSQSKKREPIINISVIGDTSLAVTAMITELIDVTMQKIEQEDSNRTTVLKSDIIKAINDDEDFSILIPKLEKMQGVTRSKIEKCLVKLLRRYNLTWKDGVKILKNDEEGNEYVKLLSGNAVLYNNNYVRYFDYKYLMREFSFVFPNSQTLEFGPLDTELHFENGVKIKIPTRIV